MRQVSLEESESIHTAVPWLVLSMVVAGSSNIFSSFVWERSLGKDVLLYGAAEEPPSLLPRQTTNFLSTAAAETQSADSLSLQLLLGAKIPFL